MSFAHVSAFTSLNDIPYRPGTNNQTQRSFSDEGHQDVVSHFPGQKLHSYQRSSKVNTVSSEGLHDRLDATYSTRAYASEGSHGYSFMDTVGCPFSCASSSTIGPRDVKNNADPWPTSTKCPYNSLTMYPCGSGKTAARGDKISTLKSWLYEHRKNPYPTKGEKVMLAVITKMTLTQVSTWFANARRRLKKDSKITRSAVDRSRDDGVDRSRDDGVDRSRDDAVNRSRDEGHDELMDGNNQINEVGCVDAAVAPAPHATKSSKSVSTHLTLEKEDKNALELNDSIIHVDEDDDGVGADDGAEDDGSKNELSENVSTNIYQNSPFTADPTKDSEISQPSDRSLFEAVTGNLMPDNLSTQEKQRRGQSLWKVRGHRSGSDLRYLASGIASGKADLSHEAMCAGQVPTREISSSTCSRPKIWSVTDFINTPLSSTSLTTTSSLSTTAVTATTEATTAATITANIATCYSSLSPASAWTSNTLHPMMTTLSPLPSAAPKSLASQRFLSLSHDGVLQWPPSAASPFARLNRSYQPTSAPYPHTTSRLVPTNSQETPATADDKTWQAVYIHSLYPRFPARVVFSSP